MEPYPTISRIPEVQADYEAMRRDGQSHNMAEILALRAAPRAHGTDSGFMRGVSGKKWISQLGKRTDPNAWVSGADDVRRVCKARGWGCEGLVNVPMPEHDEPVHQPYRVAEDLVDEEVKRRCDEDPGLPLRRDPREIREEAREAISPVAGGM